jgi:hypothetical protein
MPAARAIQIDDVGSVGDQATAPDEERERIDRGQPIPSCEFADDVAVSISQCANCDDQAVVRTTRERGDCRFNLVGVAHDQWVNSTPNDGATPWIAASLSDPDRCEGITKNCHPGHAGRNLFEQFEPFDA